MDDLIRKYVLQNAIRYNGKATPGAIIGKVFGEKPELREKGKEISQKINELVKDINSMSVEEQTEELGKIAPEMLEKKTEERDIFAFLNLKGKVNTAFPPGPEKYPHIGHAKAILLNYMLALQTGGKFILRFEKELGAQIRK